MAWRTRQRFRSKPRTELLAGIESRRYIDIDSLLRPVFGYHKQGASFGHTKIAGQAVAPQGALAVGDHDQHPDRRRRWWPGSGSGPGRPAPARGAASMVNEAIKTARAAGASGKILVRGDSAFGIGPVVPPASRPGAQFSVVLAKNPSVTACDRRDPRGRLGPGALPRRRP